MTYSTTWNVESSYCMDLNSRPEAQEPDVQAQMPEIVASTPPGSETQPGLIEESPEEIDRSAGFDPYDTGVLQYKKIQD